MIGEMEGTLENLGRVKWFNNKAGYGFITVTSGKNITEDVFVHHSAINVSEEQYRYLIEGEYVAFNMCHVNDTKHKWQAESVKGIDNGKLMCETHFATRNNYEQKKEGVKSRGVGPRGVSEKSKKHTEGVNLNQHSAV